jgi:heterodisulfide reductase subunit A-like polyferredoxin
MPNWKEWEISVTSTNAETSTNAMGNNAGGPCGAVLVCGAGLAGIHASLDLSAAGYRVYLVEEGPGNHGGTAEDDKMPAASESISRIALPKLVECERDPNIDVFTTSEVIAVEGEPGNLKATIRRRPRPTDDDNGAACGEQQEESFDREVGAVLLTKSGQDSFPPSQLEKGSDAFLVVQESEDVADTITRASATAVRAMTLLAEARGSLVQKRVYPPERDVTDEPPRVGVFVCHCGTDISSVVNVETLVERSRQMPNVALAEANVYTCACGGQDRIIEAVAQYRLNRVVIAGCSPLTHESMFRDTLRCAGLNPHLVDMANIRDQCARVHADRPTQATEKAIDLVRMAVGRAAHLVPVPAKTVPVRRMALVIGGGMAGMTAALALADQGFPVRLVEKGSRLGGPTPEIESHHGETMLADTVKRVESHRRIRVNLDAIVSKMEGRIGDFTTTIDNGSQVHEVKHGVVVVAPVAAEQEPKSSSGGQDEAVQARRANREELARVLRVPLNAEGFFVQVHPEFRPVDSVREGVFLCDVPDAAKSITHANAAAARASSVLSRREVQVRGMTAWVDPQKCISCMTCVHVCPFMAPQVGENNKSEVQDTVCMGCGTCSAECPAKAITLQNYIDDQILGAIDSLLAPNVEKKEFVLTYPDQVGIASPRWHASQTE